MKITGEEAEVVRSSSVVEVSSAEVAEELSLIHICNAPQAEKSGNVIVFSVTGKPIIPRSENQLKLVEALAKNDMLFAIGPAGSA